MTDSEPTPAYGDLPAPASDAAPDVTVPPAAPAPPAPLPAYGASRRRAVAPAGGVPQPPAGGFGPGVAAALGAAVVGAILWAVITVVTDYRIGFVAVGIGFLVGLAIERFGGGDARLPVIGAIVALAGCVAGDLLADAHIIAKDLHLGITDVLQHPHALWSTYTDWFRAFDGVFYAIAAYEGFRFGRRGVARARLAHQAAQQQPPHQPPPTPPPATA